MKTPFRYDFVGSFLRPQRLKDARKDFEEGKITQADLTKVEDECIVDLVNKIKGLGYHVITDGEFRRSTWHLDFMWGFEGIEHQKTVEGNTTFDAEAAMIDDTYMTGKISVKNHPFVEHFKYVKADHPFTGTVLCLLHRSAASCYDFKNLWLRRSICR